jgi:pilus assembly protein Flp/PilA
MTQQKHAAAGPAAGAGLGRRTAALARDIRGVTAIEYGLIVGAIAVAIIAAVFALGGDIANLFASAGSAMNSSVSSGTF